MFNSHELLVLIIQVELEQFSIECRNMSRIALVLFIVPCDWLKKFRATYLNQSEEKLIVSRLQTFSRASTRLHELALTFDWFTGLTLSFVIG